MHGTAGCRAAGSVLLPELCLRLCFESHRKMRCKFFVQNHGHCPFKSDCIYLHELPAGQPPRIPIVSGVVCPGGLGHGMAMQHGSGPGLILSLVLQEFSPSLESFDEEDDEICVLEWAVTLTEADFRYSRNGYEMRFNLSNSS